MTHQKPNISLILPVYNVEKYLFKCLDSICSQQFSGNIEIIAVEAFSTDNSLAILKSFQRSEPRLIIIELGIREKLSTSRVVGMNASTGDYIMHVDSDDYLLPDSLENIFQKCLETDADVVVFDNIIENSFGKRSYAKNIKRKVITSEKFKVQTYFFGAVWRKVVKRALIEKMIYSEIGITATEDFIYSTEILLRAHRICLVPEFYYVYLLNSNSLTNQFKAEEYLQNQYIILSQVQKIITLYKPEEKILSNILDYFEKWIYLEIARIHFWQKGKLEECVELIRRLFQFPVMTQSRIRRLELSINSGFVCLFEVAIRFGFRMSFGIIVRKYQIIK